MKKKLAAIVLTMAMAASFAAGCGTVGGEKEDKKTEQGSDKLEESEGETKKEETSENDGDKVYKIGICQQLEHQALDAATEGFKAALEEKLGDKVEFDYQNGQGEQTNCATIATKFVNDNVDLIMANATTALQACSAATSEIPVIGTSVTDFVEAGVAESNDAPGRNVTGTSDLAPIDQQIELLTTLVPDAGTVGILYCSAEANSVFQAEKAEEALDAKEISHERYIVADSNDIQSVVTNAVGECDVIYIPTDNTIADNMEGVKNITTPAKIPVICGEENMCAGGGLATLSISYYNIGYNAGLMAYEILTDGKNPAEMPIQYADEVTEKYNPEIAEALGIEMPSDMVAIGSEE
ncbi:MAG: ABC transporter substrate-binding protein [Lachnospiraceae bacterium]|nr:ABC transporter substrate-binding protein [Lachnospiraceae bacterium]